MEILQEVQDLLTSGQSANKLWKESGTTLSFKDWIQREKDKGVIIPNTMVENATKDIRSSLGIDVPVSTITKLDKNKNLVLGLNRWVLISSLLIIGGAIGYSIYKKRK
jgi:hypothetical protein